MDTKEKGLCLRVINELMRSYTQINLAPSSGISGVNFDDTILTPSWLLDIKKEVILGKHARLADVIEKIKAVLVDCLRQMGPYFTALCRILLHEQILQYEILKLPRSLKNEFKTNDQQQKAIGKQKLPKMAMRRRVDKQYFQIHSTLINAVFEEQHALKKGKIVTTPVKNVSQGKNVTITVIGKEKETSKPKISDKSARGPKKSKMPMKKKNTKGDNVKVAKETPTLTKCSTTETRKCIKSIKKGSDKGVAMRKKEAASKRCQNCTPANVVQTKRGQPSRLRRLLTLARDIGQKKDFTSEKGPEKIKLGKRKLPMNKGTEATNDSLSTSQNILKTADFCSMVEEHPIIKLTRMSGTYVGHHLENLIGKKKPPSNLPTALTTQSNQKIGETRNLNTCLSTTTATLRTSTPRKDRGTTIGNDIVSDLTGTYLEESGDDILIESPHEKEREADIELEVQKTMSLLTSQAVVREAVIAKHSSRKKRSSKFQLKGNQLMGIEEEEILVQSNEDIRVPTGRNGQSTVEEIDAVLKNTDNNLVACEESRENISSETSSKSSKRLDDGSNKNSTEEIQLLSDEKEDDDEPKVLKVISSKTYKTISRKLLRLMNQVNRKDSDIMVEKVIIDEVISDKDEHDDQPLSQPPLQKKSEEVTHVNYRKRKSSAKKSTPSSHLKNSAKNTVTAKKQLVEVQAKKRAASLNRTILIEEDQLINPDGESHPNDSLNLTNDDSAMRLAEEWLNSELAPSVSSLEVLTHIPEIPEISCFLHVCQKALRLPFFTHFEFELSLIIPHASCLMATVVTALLSGAPSSKETKTCTPLPFLIWNRKLTARLSFWFLIYKRLKDSTKVQDLIGLEPKFWKILGNKRNPLTLKPFHLLPIHERIMILKGLCDNLLYVSKRIQTALISTPRGGREGNWLGEDNQGLKYLYIPIFLRDCFGNLCVYCIDKSKGSTCIMEETFPETETTNPLLDLTNKEISEKEESNEKTGQKNENLLVDKTFSLVADNAEKLHALLATISSPYSENELVDAEKKLNSKVIMKEEITDKELFKSDNEDDPPVSVLPNKENIDNRNEQLLLSIKLKSLAESVEPKGNVLLKSRNVALVKLHMEWIEFNKDGFCAIEKAVSSNIKHQKRRNEKRSHVKRKDQEDDNFEGPSNTKCGQQPLPLRTSLSRKAKSKAGSLIQEEETQHSRKEIVSEMEERALTGINNWNKEDMKWDSSLWADDDSDDDQHVDLEVEESIWHGYAAIQKEAKTIVHHPPLSIQEDSSHETTLAKHNSGFIKTYAKQGSLTSHKNQTMVDVPLKQNIKVGKPIVITGKSSTDSRDKIKTWCQKFNHGRLQSFKIKIKKEDVDSFIDNNKPELLTHLVRKTIADKQTNAIEGKNLMVFRQNHTLSNNTNRDLDVSNGLPPKKDLIEIEEINPPQYLRENILNSLERRKLTSKSGSLDLPTEECRPELFSTPLKVVQLTVPFSEAGGKNKSYSKPEIDKVTQFVLKAVNGIYKKGNFTTPQAIKVGTTVQNENQKSTSGEDCKETLSSLSSLGSKPGESMPDNGLADLNNIDQLSADESSKTLSHENSAISVVELSSDKETSNSKNSGFKPFPLKSLNAKGLNTIINNGSK